MITDAQKAYVAGVIDARGRLTSRNVNGTILPSITVEMKLPAPLLDTLCEWTGVKPILFSRDYARTNCALHCPELHNHVHGDYKRWILTGKKAAIVLSGILEYLTIHREQAEELLALNAPFKGGTVDKMKVLGWEGDTR